MEFGRLVQRSDKAIGIRSTVMVITNLMLTKEFFLPVTLLENMPRCTLADVVLLPFGMTAGGAEVEGGNVRQPGLLFHRPSRMSRLL